MTKFITIILILTTNIVYSQDRDLTIYYNDTDLHGQAIFRQLTFDFERALLNIKFDREEVAPLIFFLQDLQTKRKYITDNFNIKFVGSSDLLKIRFGRGQIHYLRLIPENLEFDGYINYLYLLCKEFRYDRDLDRWKEITSEITREYNIQLTNEVSCFLENEDYESYYFYEYFGGLIGYLDLSSIPVIYKDGEYLTLEECGFIPSKLPPKLRPKPDYSEIIFFEPQRIGYIFVP